MSVVGENIKFTYFQNLTWNSVHGGMIVDITTKLMEAEKTGGEAEVMNWERRKLKGTRG